MEGTMNGGRSLHPVGSAVEGLPDRLLGTGISPQLGACLEAATIQPGEVDSCQPCGNFRCREETLRGSPPGDRRWPWQWWCCRGWFDASRHDRDCRLPPPASRSLSKGAKRLTRPLASFKICCGSE